MTGELIGQQGPVEYGGAPQYAVSGSQPSDLRELTVAAVQGAHQLLERTLEERSRGQYVGPDEGLFGVGATNGSELEFYVTEEGYGEQVYIQFGIPYPRRGVSVGRVSDIIDRLESMPDLQATLRTSLDAYLDGARQDADYDPGDDVLPGYMINVCLDSVDESSLPLVVWGIKNQDPRRRGFYDSATEQTIHLVQSPLSARDLSGLTELLKGAHPLSENQ